MPRTLRRGADGAGQPHTISGVSSDSGAARTHGRVRGFVAARSASQRVGVLALLAVLVTAPFGGLDRASGGRYAPLHLGSRYDIGPFYLTVDKVVSLSDLAPAVSPQKKRDRLLVIEITITNHTDAAESAALAVATLGGDHTGAIPWPDDVESAKERGDEVPTTPVPLAFNVADGSRMDTEPVNPGQSYQLAVVVEQVPDWKPDDFILSVLGLEYEEEDPTTLDDGHWVQHLFIAQGHVDVEVKP
jgi:hypothetical protein